jgi:hypothetical protein
VAKLIIFSIVLMSFAVPLRLSVAPQPRRAIRRMQWIMCGFILVWAWMCLHWYPSLVVIE